MWLMLATFRPREVAHGATLLGGAILRTDLLEGRGTITSIKGTTPTGWVRFWGGENETWDWM